MQLLVAGGRQGFEWIFLDNRSFLKVVAEDKGKEDKGEEDQMEIQKLKEHSSVYHIPLRVLEGPSFLAHVLSGYLCSLMTNLCKFSIFFSAILEFLADCVPVCIGDGGGQRIRLSSFFNTEFWSETPRTV